MNQEALEANANPWDLGTVKCCGLLKTQGLLNALQLGEYDGVIGGARREEERSRAKVSKLFNNAGLFVITAFISPYQEDRAAAREIIGTDRFIEVYLNASLEVCEQRDTKGLYAKARAGQIAEFTGISAPYEPPVSPELTIDTGARDLDQSVATLFDFLWDRRH